MRNVKHGLFRLQRLLRRWASKFTRRSIRLTVLDAHGVNAIVLFKVKEADANPNILDYLQERKIDLSHQRAHSQQAKQLLRHPHRRLRHPTPSSRIQRASHNKPATRRCTRRRPQAERQKRQLQSAASTNTWTTYPGNSGNNAIGNCK